MADGGTAGGAFDDDNGPIETETARMLAAARVSSARFKTAMLRRRGELREWALLVAGIALFVVGSLAMRETVVRLVPATARVYAAVGMPVNIRGLALRNITFERQNENGIMVLAIKGEVVNIRDEALTVPKLRFGLHDGQQQELYHWYMKVKKNPLQAEEAAPFVARLASPPADAYAVEVRLDDAPQMAGAFRP